MPRIYRTKIEVRSYELDSFGHVNHAVYLHYLETARWKMLEMEGITLEKLRQWDRFPVIAWMELSYLKPTFLGELLDIATTITEMRGSSFLGEQVIYRNDQVVLKAKLKGVMVDGTGRPAGMPASMERLGQDTGDFQ
jgi:YbgC/YbaW family acyl-CoA thioester hydrolase